MLATKNHVILDWDSQFFGFKVAQIDAFSPIDLAETLDELQRLDVRLVYVFEKEKGAVNQEISEAWNGRLVDNKKTFAKKTQKNNSFNAQIGVYTEGGVSDELLDLAIQSGVYSRFKVDERMPADAYKRLYQTWIEKSVDKTLAKEIIIFSNPNLCGFTTVGEKNKAGDIGLVAVAPQARGQGVGKALMAAAENWFFHQDYDAIQVVTQGDNLAACRLYESAGFVCIKTEPIYHFWLK